MRKYGYLNRDSYWIFFFTPIWCKTLTKCWLYLQNYYLSLQKNIYGYIEPFKGNTKIFIRPGWKINSIDGIITNFHTPRSSLLLLIYTIIGKKKTQELYKYAIEKKIRFFCLRVFFIFFRFLGPGNPWHRAVTKFCSSWTDSQPVSFVFDLFRVF